jgi:hypothetical protein
MQQTNETAVTYSAVVLSCDAKMSEAFQITSDLLASNGHESKRAVLAAFAALESAYYMACDTANGAVQLAIEADVNASDEERTLLLERVADIQRKWQEMVWLVDHGIRRFGIIQTPTNLMVH